MKMTAHVELFCGNWRSAVEAELRRRGLVKKAREKAAHEAARRRVRELVVNGRITR